MELEYRCCLIAAICAAALPARAEQDQDLAEVVRYRSPEERREAGLGTELTPWLTFSGLTEFEYSESSTHFNDGVTVADAEPVTSNLQLGFAVEWQDWFEAEVIFEAEEQTVYSSKFDEALVGFMWRDWGIKAGQNYLPVGEFYSHFVTGPWLEFADTRQKSIIVDWSPVATLELSAGVLRNDYDHHTEWAMALNWYSEDESIRLNLGYLSNLLAAEDPPLDEFPANAQHQPGLWNINLLWAVSDNLELTLETTRTAGKIPGVDASQDQPAAENVELAWLVHHQVQLALRLEHSQELIDEAERRYGIVCAWRPFNRLGVVVEDLRADYRAQRVFDEEEDRAPRHGHIVAAALTWEF